MSIKNLFKKNIVYGSFKDLENAGEIESQAFVEEVIEEDNRFLPPVDYSTASNFVNYGLAYQYYQDAHDNIIGNYPYDGSAKEKSEWHNEASFFENWYLGLCIEPNKNNYVKTDS